MDYSQHPDRFGFDAGERSFDLRGLIAIFRRRWKAVVLPSAVLLALALVYSVTAERVYSADATLLIESPAGAITGATDLGRDPNRRLLTEVSVIEGRSVRQLVESSIGVDSPKITATPAGGADTIKLSALSPDPAKATETVNTYARAYTEFRRTQAIEDLSSTSAEVQRRITLLEAEFEQLKVESDAQVTSATSVTPTTEANPRRTAIAAQLTTLKSRLTQLELDQALRTGGAQLISPGVPAPARCHRKQCRSSGLPSSWVSRWVSRWRLSGRHSTTAFWGALMSSSSHSRLSWPRLDPLRPSRRTPSD